MYAGISNRIGLVAKKPSGLMILIFSADRNQNLGLKFPTTATVLTSGVVIRPVKNFSRPRELFSSILPRLLTSVELRSKLF